MFTVTNTQHANVNGHVHTCVNREITLSQPRALVSKRHSSRGLSHGVEKQAGEAICWRG
jgi:hypothetical protein